MSWRKEEVLSQNMRASCVVLDILTFITKEPAEQLKDISKPAARFLGDHCNACFFLALSLSLLQSISCTIGIAESYRNAVNL